MNKILMNGDIFDYIKGDNEYIASEDTIINLIGYKESIDLKITVKENIKLIINIFGVYDNLDNKISVDNYDNSSTIINNSFISNGRYNLEINNNLYGDNIDTRVNIRAINEKSGNINILLNGVDAGNTVNNRISEYAKIINKSDFSNIVVPNLIINTNNVEANHGCTIGTINEDELFYLMSKGISKDEATNLLEIGFLVSIMNSELIEVIKKYFN